MMREYFPNSDEGASLYEGFMNHQNSFCKTFEMKDSLSESILEINVVLEKLGYTSVSEMEFDDTNSYSSPPVSISPHGYQDELVLFIQRDLVSKPQIDLLTNELIKFRDERDWEQFHNPKDLAIALSIEANELLEQFLWKTSEEANNEKIKEELADVFSYAFLLAEKMKFDVEEIVLKKIKLNSEKYPINKAKGTSKKYNEL